MSERKHITELPAGEMYVTPMYVGPDSEISNLEWRCIEKLVEWRKQMTQADVGAFIGQQHYTTFCELTAAADALIAAREKAEAVEAMLDRVAPDYPNLTRDELRETFHATYDRLAAGERVEKEQGK